MLATYALGSTTSRVIGVSPHPCVSTRAYGVNLAYAQPHRHVLNRLEGTSAFDQDISDWDVESVNNMENM